MSSNEINENEIEDELNDYNLPIITVKYYFDNDIIYQKTFSKNATFGDCVKDFEKSLENNENEEDISKINYSFKNENIDPNKKIIDVVETEKNTILLEIEIGLQIQNLNTSNYKKSIEKLNNNLSSSNNNLNQNLLLKNENIQFNNKNNNNNIKNILSPTLNPFKIINYSPKESKINLYNFDPKIINEYKLNDFNQSSACVNTPNNLYLSGGINSNKVPIKNFWTIDNNKLNVNLKELPLPKSNHSMIYIPNNYIFFVGGNNKFTFYYNIKNNTFSKWADLNEIQLRPALYFDEETNELFCMSNYKDNFFIEKTNLTNFPEWEKIDVNLKDKPTFRNNFIIKKINQDKYLLIGNNNYLYDNELKEIREYNNSSPNKVGMQFLDKNLYKLNNYLDVSIPKNFNDEKEIIIVNKNGDVKKVDFEQIENENIKKENLSFKTNDRKINGNINIKIKTQKVDANNNLDKIEQQNFDNLKNNNNLLYLNDNNNNTRNLKYNVELSIPKFNKSESKILEKVKEDYVDNKPVIEDKLIEEVNEIKNEEEDENLNKYKILMKNVFEVNDYSDNVDRKVIQSEEK
jgi:hypothetical protein